MNQSWMKLLSIIRGRSQGSKILYEAKLVAGEDPLGEQLKRPDLSDVGFTKKLLEVTAWVVRFIDKVKKTDSASGPLTTQEFQRVKLYWELYN